MVTVTADRVIVELEARLDRYNRDVRLSAQRFEENQRRTQASIQRTERQIRQSSDSIKNALKNSASFIVGAFGAAQLIKLADGYTRFTNQLKVAGIEGAALAGVQSQLFAIAQRNGVELESLGTLFGRTSQGAKELGASQADLIKFTSGVAAALRIQGGAASDSRGALMQLSQALGGEIVRAEEFNSINEGARPILVAVAQGIERYGGSVSKLRRDVINGKVSSQEFFQAFLKGSDALEAKAAKVNLTIGASFTVLNNALGQFIGQTDQSLSATERVSGGIVALANNIDTVATALAVVGVAYASRMLVTNKAVQSAAGTAALYTRAIAGQNVVIVGSAQAAAQRARFIAQGAAAELAAIETTIAARTAEQAALRATIAEKTRAAAVARAEATLAAAANVQGAARTASLRQQAIASNNASFATQALTTARQRQVVVDAELAAAEAALAGAQTRSAATATAAAAATARASTVMGIAGAAAARLGKGLLAAFGGPVGLAITAITLALFYFMTRTEEAGVEVEKFAREGEDLGAHLTQLAVYARNAASGIAQVGKDAVKATGQVREFAGAVGEAAQKLHDLAEQRRKELLEGFRGDYAAARKQREEAEARIAGRTQQYRPGPMSTKATRDALRAADAADQAVIERARARELAAQQGFQRTKGMPGRQFLADSEVEGRDVEGELTRITRDLVIARERGIKSQIDLLEAQKFELTQFKKYRKQGLSVDAARQASQADEQEFRGASGGAAADREARGERKFGSRQEAIGIAGRELQGMGLRVGENRQFGGTGKGHTMKGHDQFAIDINSRAGAGETADPAERARFDALALEYQKRGFRLLWNGKVYEPGGDGPGRDIPAGQKQHRDHMHMEAPAGIVGKSVGKDSVAEAEAAMEKAAKEAAEAEAKRLERVAAEFASLDRDLLDARRNLVTSADELEALQKQEVTAAQDAYNANLERSVQQGELTRAEADRLKVVNDEIAELRKKAIARERQARLEREAAAAAERKLELDEADLSNQQEVLEAQGALATTAAERREIELQLLELQLEEQRLRLRAVIAAAERVRISETANAEEKRDAAAQAELARRRLQTLDKIAAGQREGVMRDTAGPLEEYGRKLKRTSAEVNEDFERIAVSGLESLNDQLADAIMNGESLGDVFHNVANSIIRDLIRIAIQQAIIAPLMQAFGGTPTPSAGGGGGGFWASLGQSFGGSGGGGGGGGDLFASIASIFGRKNGGHVVGGRRYLVGEDGPEPFVAPMSGRIEPANKVTSPRGGNGGGGGTTVNFEVNAPGANAQTVELIRATLAEATPSIVQASQRATMRTLGRRRIGG
jgi:tape measure domain-containing protein